jgi:CRISPR-associated endoribonuclease Cas6
LNNFYIISKFEEIKGVIFLIENIIKIEKAEKFKFAKFRFHLHPREKIYLPYYKGSALRGGFGNIFKRTVCINYERECNKCVLQEKCVYSYIFETPLPQKLKEKSKFKMQRPPHPYVFEPPFVAQIEYAPGEELIFNLILIGHGIEYLPYFIFIFEELGKRGIGKGRGKYELTGVDNEEGKRIYEAGKLSDNFKMNSLQDIIDKGNFAEKRNDQQIKINFLTPVRIILGGKLTTELDFNLFVTNLLRRFSWLSIVHCDEELEFDYKRFIADTDGVKTKARNVEWYDWERYSSKQDTRMKLGGFLGNITFEGDLKEFFPFIKLGEYIHIGKQTSFGLGKYEIVREV